jgi:hypothetical protein
MAEPSHAQQGSGFNKMLRSLGISSIARGGKDVICQKSLVGLSEFCMTMMIPCAQSESGFICSRPEMTQVQIEKHNIQQKTQYI